MDRYVDHSVEMVMEQQKVTNGITFFSWINLFKRRALYYAALVLINNHRTL